MDNRDKEEEKSENEQENQNTNRQVRDRNRPEIDPMDPKHIDSHITTRPRASSKDLQTLSVLSQLSDVEYKKKTNEIFTSLNNSFYSPYTADTRLYGKIFELAEKAVASESLLYLDTIREFQNKKLTLQDFRKIYDIFIDVDSDFNKARVSENKLPMTINTDNDSLVTRLKSQNNMTEITFSPIKALELLVEAGQNIYDKMLFINLKQWKSEAEKQLAPSSKK